MAIDGHDLPGTHTRLKPESASCIFQPACVAQICIQLGMYN